MPKVTVHHSHKKRELFNPAKLHSSLVHQALANRVPEGQAEDTAARVVKDVEKWLASRTVVTAKDIRRAAAKSLEVFDHDLAESYANHDSII